MKHVDRDALFARARSVMADLWRDGYTCPNPTVYPWQWLWDSAFHAVVWLGLGAPERAIEELRSLFVAQAPDGFVPHMTYHRSPEAARPQWGRDLASRITQPPMYGHALACLARAGVTPPYELLDRAASGLRFLLEKRRRADGRIAVLHPWETGCDDSPRFDAWYPPGPYDRGGRWPTHAELVAALELDEHGCAVASSRFATASAGFDALVVFNAYELEAAGGPRLDGVEDLEATVAAAWTVDPETGAGTWADGDAVPTATVPTADSLLPLLLPTSDRAEGWAQLADDGAFAARFGVRGVHASHPRYDPTAYWRGPAWPQLDHLLWVAAERAGRSDDAARIRGWLVDGVLASDWAEYWHPDTGEGLGARPQGWTSLAVVAYDAPPWVAPPSDAASPDEGADDAEPSGGSR